MRRSSDSDSSNLREPRDASKGAANKNGWWMNFFMWTVILGLVVFAVVYVCVLYYATPRGRILVRPKKDLKKRDVPHRTTSASVTKSGQVGDSCSASRPCNEDGECLEGVCTCQGEDVHVIKGTCVRISTSVETSSEGSPAANTPEASTKHNEPRNVTRPPVYITRRRSVHLDIGHKRRETTSPLPTSNEER
ncbi:uncharacterized protein [Dermacentor andersoni]|uniref:uncharacterized protein n=1 Tax=Dermacentor andersoni TaxID=34620 RepID=UPI0024179DAF|nr:uncharacterized protein LOC129381959 [Dermacentor andersoni]